MLIKTAVLDQIEAGRISLIFRRWKKPRIKAGGTQLTQSGLLAIDAVDVVTKKQITEKDAKAAGYKSKEALLADLYDRDEDIYRIGVHWAGEDSRKVLRQQSDLSEAELAGIIAKLRNLDTGSKRGNWTQLYLQMIH